MAAAIGGHPGGSWTSGWPGSRRSGKYLEAQRIKQRTDYDLEMMQEMGFCQGIENYSRHLTGRPPGARPYTLLDFFPDDFLTLIDESPCHGAADRRHVRRRPLAQNGAGRPRVPPALGARQPSAQVRRVHGAVRQRSMSGHAGAVRDVNSRVGITATSRPRDRRGWEATVPLPRALLQSQIRWSGSEVPAGGIRRHARPARHWWWNKSSGRPACWIPWSRCARSRARSTKPSSCAASASKQGERVLVTTLTKRTAEDLTEYLQGRRPEGALHPQPTSTPSSGSKSCAPCGPRSSTSWWASICCARAWTCPEVSLVCVLDADKEGYLR